MYFVAPSGNSTVAIGDGVGIVGLEMDGNYHQSGEGQFLASNGGTSYTSLAAWQSATGLETHGVAAGSLRFVQPQPPPALLPTTLAGATGYSPVAGSPLFNAGVNLSSFGITPWPDFLGNPWTQNTIGAIYLPGTPNNYHGGRIALTTIRWRSFGSRSQAHLFSLRVLWIRWPTSRQARGRRRLRARLPSWRATGG